MALTSQQICAAARSRAKAPGYTLQSGQYLNSLLQEIAQTYDFAVNKRAFNFQLTTATAPIGNLQANLASGPFTLPPDYLRAKRGDVIYYPTPNWPVRLIPVDLDEFDVQVQQAGFQNFPILWATDVTIRKDVVSTTGNTTAGSGTLSNIGNLNGIAVGMGVWGDAISPGTVTLVTAVNSGAGTVTVSPASNVNATYTTPAVSMLNFAVCPIAYVWPAASGSYPAFVRYYALPSDIATPESSSQIPWFPNTNILIDGVAGALMKDTGDDRWIQFLGEDQPDSVPTRMRKILQLKDDESNRSRRVHLDRRRFGQSWGSLPSSKVLGY